MFIQIANRESHANGTATADILLEHAFTWRYTLTESGKTQQQRIYRLNLNEHGDVESRELIATAAPMNRDDATRWIFSACKQDYLTRQES